MYFPVIFMLRSHEGIQHYHNITPITSRKFALDWTLPYWVQAWRFFWNTG